MTEISASMEERQQAHLAEHLQTAHVIAPTQATVVPTAKLLILAQIRTKIAQALTESLRDLQEVANASATKDSQG